MDRTILFRQYMMRIMLYAVIIRRMEAEEQTLVLQLWDICMAASYFSRSLNHHPHPSESCPRTQVEGWEAGTEVGSWELESWKLKPSWGRGDSRRWMAVLDMAERQRFP